MKKIKVIGCGERNSDGVSFCGVGYGSVNIIKYCKRCETKRDLKGENKK